MNNNLQLVLKSSTTEMSLNDHSAGIYIVPELDGLTGLPEIRTTSGVNAGYDGGWTSAQKFDARSIVIRGTIANNDKTEVERMRRELVALLAQGKNEQLELDFVTETGRAYEVQVRTIACDMALQKVLTQQDFMITLRADDPLIYDNSSAGEEATVNISGATGGFRIPFEIPLAIDAGSEETLVENTGLEAVAPTVKMYGALHNPKIINHTTNQSMQIQAELGFTEGAWISPSETQEGGCIDIKDTIVGAPLSEITLEGNTAQQTYTGKNLYDVSTLVSGTYVTADSDGWITINRDNSAGSSAVYPAAWTSNLTHIDTSTQYDVFMEVKSVSGDGGELAVTSTASGSGQFDSWQVFQITSLSAGTVYVKSPVTKSSFSGISNGLRTTLTLPAGKKCSITFRLSVLAHGAETTSTFLYEKYVNGEPAPNPGFPQPVQTTTNNITVNLFGKNMLDCSNAYSNYGGLVNTLNSDGTITTTGVPTGNYTRIMPDRTITDMLEDGSTYTVSRTNTDNNVAVQVQAPKIGGGTDYYTGTFTVNKSTHSSFKIVVQTATTERWGSDTRTITSGYQLEKGPTPTEFEPFKSQQYSIGMISANKNIFDKAKAEKGYRIGANGSRIEDVAYFLSDWIPIEPSTQYVVSPGTYLNYSAIATYKADMTFLRRLTGASFSSITTESNAAYIRIATSLDSLETTQIEKGAEASSFVACQPVELCQIGNYQNYIYNDAGVWKLHNEIIRTTLNGSEAWSSTTAHTRVRDFRMNSDPFDYPATGGNSALAFMDKFIGIPEGASRDVECFWFNQNGYLRIALDATLAANVDGFKTWLSNNNVTMYSVLETPIETVITNETLVQQLDYLANEAKTYGGMTHITSSAILTNLPATLKAAAFLDKDPDQRDELIIDSRLRTITLNGLDVYHLQAPGSEFLMLAPGENKLSLQSDIVGDNGYAKVSYKQGYLSI